MDEVYNDGIASVASHVQNVMTHCDSMYLTVDIDVLDRAYAPGTVAALHGGMTPRQLQGLVAEVCSDFRVMGMDIVEFDPERDPSGITAQAVAHTVYTALTAVARRRERRA
jgi:agmatinase